MFIHPIEDAWRRHTAAPLCSDSAFVEEIIWQKYVKRNKTNVKIYPKITPTKRRKSWKIGLGGSKIMKNEVREATWSHLGPKSVQSRKSHSSSIALGLRFGHFGSHFGGQFRLKSDLFRHRFLHQISEGIFRGFWWISEVIFMTFWLQTGSESEKAKRWKTYVLQKENLCFGGSRAFYFHLKIDKKRCRNARRNRNRLFHDFWWISASISRSKIEKNDKKSM